MIVRIRRGVTDHFSLRHAEWVASAIMLHLGYILWLPGDTFGTSSSYDVMASMASESTWGACLMTLAAIRLFALFFNGTFKWFRRYSPSVRAVAAFASAGFFFVMAQAILDGNQNATSSGTYFILAISDIILFAIVAGEAGDAYRKVDNVA